MDNDKTPDDGRDVPPPSLPPNARLPINRCNLPAVILGGLRFQAHPVDLHIDGVGTLHKDLFARLSRIDDENARAQQFIDYMAVHFCLEQLEEAGLMPDTGHARGKADYLNTLRGWHFDAEGREGAVLKGWVESRFGLLPRWHGGPIETPDNDAYRRYEQERAMGLYNTNALEAQLDLLYAYCQYELKRRHPGRSHCTLYRGINRLQAHEVLRETNKGHPDVLLNNINSFSASRERAGEFGDYILEAKVPLPKIFVFNQLLPKRLKGEDEYIVIGGVYRVRIALF